MISKPFRFHELPKDLARVVFEMLADSDSKDASQRALVSKEVKHWVEPILYRSIRIAGSELQAICELVTDPKSTKPPDFFARHVKSLAFPGQVNMEEVLVILKACRCISSLSFRYSYPSGGDQASIKLHAGLDAITASSPLGVPFPKLRELSIWSYLFPYNQKHFAHLIFKGLTHLSVEWFSSPMCEWDWKTGLGQLEQLTHLQVIASPHIQGTFGQEVGNILALCPPSLQVFIAGIDTHATYTLDGLEVVKGIHRGELDVRVVVAASKSWGKSLKNDVHVDDHPVWFSNQDRELELKRVYPGDSHSIWRRAEKMIENRRRKLQVE